MAKLTALELENAVLKKLGEAQVATMTALTGIQLVAFDSLIEVLAELSTDYQYQQLEKLGTFTMTSAVATYAEPTDLIFFDKDSVRCTDNTGAEHVDFLTKQEWNEEYPEGIGTSTTGYPSKITKFAGFWYTNKYPALAQNAKIVSFDYWSTGAVINTATSTSTCWIPEPWDRTLLVNYATYLAMHYKGHPEAMTYYRKVFGGQTDTGGVEEGELEKFKDLMGSPILKARFTYKL